MAVAYRRSGLVLKRDAAPGTPLVTALQRDLRRLGYLRAGIDGQFGEGTERAVRALQWDLIHPVPRAADGEAPVLLRALNRGRVGRVTGILDENLAACLEDILADPQVRPLPRSDDPVRANREAFAAVQALIGLRVPRPFLLAMLLQESGGQHFRTPTAASADDFIVVGLDRNDAGQPDHITSRGYGMGQYTLFHHPPRTEEVETLMLDPARNVQRTVGALHDKLERFVTGPTPGRTADDRMAELGPGPLRRCRYAPGDPRYLTDCVRCAGEVLADIDTGSPLHARTTETLRPTPYHPATRYARVPDRAKLGCDWPYAVRRYNGSGVNSYHYQYQVLQRLTRPPLTA